MSEVCQKGARETIVGKKGKVDTKISRETLIAMFLIGCLSLSLIGGIGLTRLAGAWQISNEGWVVFARQDSGIWIMDADGKNEKQITDIEAGNPVCSPDGQRIAFSGFSCIYVMNADGSNMKQITNGGYDDFPTWSPDGRQIAFTRAVVKHEVENEAIYVMSSDGANLKRLTDGQPFFDRWPSWSPDGRKIAFQQWSQFPAVEQICTMDANGDNREVVYEKGECPVWSPDGKRIAFAAISIEDDTLDIYVMDADGVNVRELAHREGWYEDYPTWSPDGTKIAFSSYPSSRWDERDIYVMDADGSNVQQLTKTKENEYTPDWTAYSYAVELIGKLGNTWGRIKTK
jgi:Tol biopolymer transport system component